MRNTVAKVIRECAERLYQRHQESGLTQRILRTRLKAWWHTLPHTKRRAARFIMENGQAPAGALK